VTLKRAVCMWCQLYLSRHSKWPLSVWMRACSLFRNASTVRSIASCGKSFQIASSTVWVQPCSLVSNEHFVTLKHSAQDVVVERIEVGWVWWSLILLDELWTMLLDPFLCHRFWIGFVNLLFGIFRRNSNFLFINICRPNSEVSCQNSSSTEP